MVLLVDVFHVFSCSRFMCPISAQMSASSLSGHPRCAFTLISPPCEPPSTPEVILHVFTRLAEVSVPTSSLRRVEPTPHRSPEPTSRPLSFPVFTTPPLTSAPVAHCVRTPHSSRVLHQQSIPSRAFKSFFQRHPEKACPRRCQTLSR